MTELVRKYVIMTMASPAPFDPSDFDAPFVLKPWKDPAALRALMTYRDHCYPELARELDAWIEVIRSGPVVRGDVGRRNEGHLGADGGRGRPAGATGVSRPRAGTARSAGAKGKGGRPTPARKKRRK